MPHTRRQFLRTALSGAAIALVPACGGLPSSARAQVCEAPTSPDIEGPFYVEGAPLRTTLANGTIVGTPLLLSGRVLAGCRGAADAELDLWQADDAGEYDLRGFGLRGRFRVGSDGRFEIPTIVPGHYLNGAQFRPAHIHVKVRVPGRAELTTQLYFDGDPYNAIDPWFRSERAIHTHGLGSGLAGEIDLVLP